MSPGLETNPRIREKSNCYRNHTSLQNCLHRSMDAFVTKKKKICQWQRTRGLGYNGRPCSYSAPSAESWHSHNSLSLFIFFFPVLEGNFEAQQNLDWKGTFNLIIFKVSLMSWAHTTCGHQYTCQTLAKQGRLRIIWCRCICYKPSCCPPAFSMTT